MSDAGEVEVVELTHEEWESIRGRVERGLTDPHECTRNGQYSREVCTCGAAFDYCTVCGTDVTKHRQHPNTEEKSMSAYTAHHVENEQGWVWVVSQDDYGWLPGSYDSEEAAIAASTVDHGVLVELAHRVCPHRPLTLSDIEETQAR